MSFAGRISLDAFDSSHGGSSESPEIHTLYRVSGSLALLSCIGALFVIITFITIKDLKKHPTRMIFFLSVCDVLFSLKYLVTAVLPHSDSFQTKRVACYLQAGIQQFFGLASIGWSGMISLNLIISTSRPFENSSTYSKFYHGWIWSYSIVTSAILFKNYDVIGPSGDGTCWIKAEDKPLLLMFFIPLLAYFSISISSLIIAAISTRNKSLTSSTTNNSWSDRNRTGMLLRMSTYTLVFILCWAGPLAHRISQIAGHHDAPNQASVLMFFDAIGVSIQGFMNALIWITNPSILRGFLGNIMKYLPFSKKFIKDGENTPLIRSLQDENQDPTQLAVMLRNNILTCSLRGIALSVNDNLNLSNSSSLNNNNNQSHIGGDIHQHLPFDSLSSSSPSSSSTPINHNYNSNNNINNNNNNSNDNFDNINEQFKVYTEKELFKDIFDISPDTNMGSHKFKDYCPNIFAKIRALNNITPSDYLKSFDSSLFFENLSNQKFSEGKSGSFMCFSPDNKFLIKTITRQESVLLKKKINNFYNYLVKNNHSFLLRFYGCHKISMPNDHTIYLAIMSNVFGTIPQGIKIRERYDLKGSKVNRGGNDPLFKGDGLGLDLDFVNFRKFLNLPDGFSHSIIQQLKNDSAFLTSLNIMDYSLLIGVIPNNDDFKKKLIESGGNINNILSGSNLNNNNSNSNSNGNCNSDSTKSKFTSLNSWDAPPLANVLPDPSYCQDIVDSENNFIVPSVKHTILDVDNLFNNLIQNTNNNNNNDFKSSTMIGKPFSSGGDGSTSPLISGLSSSSIIPNGNGSLAEQQQQQQQSIPESEIPIDIKVLQLSGSRMFFNRELSELIYFYRILYEAYNPTYPILERVRFIAITSQNLDMYFCKRALKLRLGYISTRKTLKPEEHYINMVLNTTRNLINEIYNIYMNILAPELSNNNVFIIKYSDLTEPEKIQLRGFFLQHVFPLMTPLVVDAGHPFPNLSNLSLNIAVLLKHDEDTTRFVRIKVPQRIPRFVHIKQRSNYSIIPMEEIILANLDTLFPNTKILTKSLFRVSRHNDLKLSGEDQANDLLELIKTELHKRKFAPMVRLEVSHNMPAEILDMLKTQLALDAYDVYVINGPLGLQDLFELCKLNLPHLKFQPWVPHIPSRLVNLAKYPSEDVFSVIRKGELLVNLPYLSFNSSVQFFIESAVKDPKVLAIKIAIYRTNSNSQLIRALCEAASHKEVMVLVDLKASGDEEQNTKFARLLEQAGCHVSYGLVGLKTHAKIAMVVREEENGLREYLNISTGNYNASTSDVYADICLFSCDPDLGEDMCNLFNYLTGYSRVSSFKKLLIAPMNMRSTLIQLIDNEAKNAREGKDATINAVMNGLDDKRLVNALYQASIAGVKITLVVRGRCRILPGIKGISENIKVISILGRFLEHSRIYCFHNNGKPKAYIASADWLHRNLKRRVEVMVPVDDANNIKQLYEIINVYCNDSNAWEMLSDGRYKKRSSPIDEDSQTQFMNQTNQKHPVIWSK